MWRGQASRAVVLGSAMAVFSVCCILPVGYLLLTTLTATQGAYGALLLDERQRGLLFNTALLGSGTAVFATLLGAPLGLALARVPLARKGLLRLVLAAPAFLPPYVMALAWVYLGSTPTLFPALSGRGPLSAWTYSLPGAVVVSSLLLYPISMLATEAALRRIDGRLEEAAMIVAPPGRLLRRITLPLAAPSVLAGALVIFVLAVSDFGVPGLLRVRVYTTEVFTAFAALYDFSRAIVLAMPLLLVCAAVAAIAAAPLGERLVAAPRPTGTRPPAFHGAGRAAAMFILVVILLAVVLPLVILGREALRARSIGAALEGSGEAIANSLVLSGVGATAVVALGGCLGYARSRAGRRVGLLADVLCVVAFAAPSTIVGIGLIGVWNRHGLPGTAYGTDAMLLLGYLARFLPVSTLILAAGIASLPVSHEEAAALSGAGWLRAMSQIVLPQIRLVLAAAWVIVFVLAFGELGTSILVAPPGETTLPIRIYTMIANAPPSHVAALALLQALTIFAPIALLGAAASLREVR